jgi:hypothetical protein
MRIALEELSEVLEANISTIQLGTRENLLSKYNRASGELTLQEDSTEDI